ncbi:hypothetical protein AAZX31_14G148600 [Glycine max]
MDNLLKSMWMLKSTLPFPSGPFPSQYNTEFPSSCTVQEARQPIQLGPHREQSQQPASDASRTTDSKPSPEISKQKIKPFSKQNKNKQIARTESRIELNSVKLLVTYRLLLSGKSRSLSTSFRSLRNQTQ